MQRVSPANSNTGNIEPGLRPRPGRGNIVRGGRTGLLALALASACALPAGSVAAAGEQGAVAVALGVDAQAPGTSAVAVGFKSIADGLNASALSSYAEAQGWKATALGHGSKAVGEYATGIGVNNLAEANRATAVGTQSKALAESALAVGDFAKAAAHSAIAMGTRAEAAGAASLALGADAQAKAGNSVALGAGSSAARGAQETYTAMFAGKSTSTGEVAVGGRQLTGVAAGSEDQDGVNVAQLRAGFEQSVQAARQYTDAGVTAAKAHADKGVAGAIQHADRGAKDAKAHADRGVAGAIAHADQGVAKAIDHADQGMAKAIAHADHGDAALRDSAVLYDRTAEGDVNHAGVTLGRGAPVALRNVAPGTQATDAVNLAQLDASATRTLDSAHAYTDGQVQPLRNDLWQLGRRVDALRKDMEVGIAAAMGLKQAPAVSGRTTYYAGVGAYRDEAALGLSLRRTADNGRWSVEGGASGNRDGVGGYIGVSGVLGR